jgi:uncharacterized protein YkwD
MVDRGFLFHTNLVRVFPNGQAGEVVGYGATVEVVVTEMLASQPHRDVILGGAWRKTGVGIVRAGGRLWVTQIFRD